MIPIILPLDNSCVVMEANKTRVLRVVSFLPRRKG